MKKKAGKLILGSGIMVLPEDKGSPTPEEALDEVSQAEGGRFRYLRLTKDGVFFALPVKKKETER